ncbi:hypothetical protein FLAG1_11703, partial [Fusarium langsethiae]
MTLRRSKRIAAIALATAPTHAHVDQQNVKKRETRGSDEEDTSRKKKKASTRKTKKPKDSDSIKSLATVNDGRQPGQPAPHDALSVLPAEILENILANIEKPKSMINLASTSKRNHALVMPVVHNHIAVQVRCFGHISSVIKMLEPYLSISQKKQIRREEGRYKGQQKRFSSRLDPDAVPPCAQYVRQMTVGSIEPGEKHKKFVLRTLDEALKNLSNLEVLDVHGPTDAMAYGIVALKKLKALRIWNDLFCYADRSHNKIKPLSQLRGLEHISIRSTCPCMLFCSRNPTLQTILLNSSSTLESLEIGLHVNLHEHCEDYVPARNACLIKQGFPALKSLSLRRPLWRGDDGSCLSDILRNVNFLQLRKLEVMQLEKGYSKFFRSIRESFGSADVRTVKLRQLTLDMNANQPNVAASEAHMEVIYRFIASFDTLTSLEIHDHNAFMGDQLNNPGLSERLQQVVIMHPGIESLRFRYTREFRPFASANTVRFLTQNLPRLRVLEIPLEEDDFDGVTLAISHAKNLETLICSSFNSLKHGFFDAIRLRNRLIGGLLRVAGDNPEFVWERVYRLNQITIIRDSFSVEAEFSIGSNLEPVKNLEPPSRVWGDGGRS